MKLIVLIAILAALCWLKMTSVGFVKAPLSGHGGCLKLELMETHRNTGFLCWIWKS